MCAKGLYYRTFSIDFRMNSGYIRTGSWFNGTPGRIFGTLRNKAYCWVIIRTPGRQFRAYRFNRLLNTLGRYYRAIGRIEGAPGRDNRTLSLYFRKDGRFWSTGDDEGQVEGFTGWLA